MLGIQKKTQKELTVEGGDLDSACTAESTGPPPMLISSEAEGGPQALTFIFKAPQIFYQIATP